MPVSKEQFNKELDQRWMDRLRLKEGQTLTATALSSLILEKMGELQSLYPYDNEKELKEKKQVLLKGIALYLSSGEV